jgi:DNA-binding NarL/FixJ family response regulator
MTTVLLVDDDAMYRRALTAFLDATFDIDVVGEAGTGEEAVELAERLQPDAAVVDVAMPGVGGLELAARLKAVLPEVAIVLVTGNVAGVDPQQARAAGVEQVFAKGDPLPVENALRALGRRR